MNVVDTSGWLEYLGDGPNADSFTSAIQDVESLIVPTIVIYETYKRSMLHLPTVDSIILATARRFGATVWTQDAHFESLPDVRFFPK